MSHWAWDAESIYADHPAGLSVEAAEQRIAPERARLERALRQLDADRAVWLAAIEGKA